MCNEKFSPVCWTAAPSNFELATLPPAPGRRQAAGKELLSQFFSYQLRTAMSSATMENIEDVSSEIWKELEEASKVEPPLNIKPYYDDMVKREDPISKEVVDFKKPSEMTAEE
jgi:hypothetical protein